MCCNLLLMASLSTMWTVIVGLLAVVTLVSIVLFLLKSREVTTLKKEVEELRDTMRMMRYEEINLSRMLHTVDKDSITPEPLSLTPNPSSLTPNPSPEERGTAGIAEGPDETFSEEQVMEEPISEESISEEPISEESISEASITESSITEDPITENPIAEELITKEAPLEDLDVETADESLESPNEIIEDPITEESIAEELITEEPIAEEAPVEELNVEVADEAIESPAEIIEAPEPAPVVIGTHKQAINERRPAIPNDLFAAWFAENDAPQIEEEVSQDVEEQATPVSTEAVPSVEEPIVVPAANVILETTLIADESLGNTPNDLVGSSLLGSGGRGEAQEAVDEAPSQPEALSKEDERFCRKLERLVNTRMRNPNLNIDVIAAQFGIGRTNFYRKVRELMGMSPNDYLRKCRMERAAELLRSTEQPVADICAQVGMPDAQYFSRVFKSYFGMPPSTYREQQD